MLGKTVKFLILTVLWVTVPCLMAQEATQGSLAFTGKASQIRDAVRSTMGCRRMPGLSLAVVHNNKVQMEEAFGKRELFLPENDTRADVRNDTIFCIGSLTKAFTTTLVAKLLHQSNGSYTWNTRLSDLFGPDWYLAGHFRTTRVTIADALAHKVGFGQFAGAWVTGWDPNRSRRDYCSRLHYITEEREFRTQFYYSNFGYMLAACIVEQISRRPYEQVLKEKILDPLGMTNTEFPKKGKTDWSRYARSYVYYDVNDTFIKMHETIVEDFFPAESSGGLCSTAPDLAQWQLFHLGKWSDLFYNTSILQDTYTSQMSRQDRGRFPPQWPVSMEYPTYGFGWNIGNYRGFRRIGHPGTLSGYSSLITLYPDKKTGMYTAVNGPMHGDAYNGLEALHHQISDILLDQPPWLDNSTLCSYPKPWQSSSSEETRENDEPYNYRVRSLEGFTADLDKNKMERMSSQIEKYNIPGQMLPRNNLDDAVSMVTSPQQYVGVYGHRLFGNITVTHNTAENRLYFRAGKYGEGYLVPIKDTPGFEGQWFGLEFQGAVWYFQHTGPARGVQPPVLFVEKSNNVYNGIYNIPYQVSDPPTFRRGVKWTDPGPPRPTQCPPGPSTCPPRISNASTAGASLLTLLFCFTVGWR